MHDPKLFSFDPPWFLAYNFSMVEKRKYMSIECPSGRVSHRKGINMTISPSTRLQRAVLFVSLLFAGLGILQARETVKLTDEDLAGHRFRFSWRQGNAGGVNGILVLDKEGRVKRYP